MSAWGLAWAWIRHRPLGAALNVAMLGVGTATIALLMMASQQFEQRLNRDADAVDMVVGAKGSPMQLVLSSVFHADAPVGNLRMEDAEFLRRHEMVETLVPLALGDAFRGFRIVGTDHQYLSLYDAETTAGRLWEEPLEAVLGAATAARTGLRVGDRFVGEHGIGGAVHDDHPYDTVGVLAPTGTVVDRLVLTSVETVQLVHGMESGTDPHDGHGHEDGPHDGHGHEDGPHDGHGHEDGPHDGHGHEDDGPGRHEPHRAPGGGEVTEPEAGAQPPSKAPRNPLPETLRPPEITAFLVGFSSPMAAVALPREINRSTAMQAARPAQEIRRLFRLVGFGTDVVRAFALILVAGAVLGQFAALVQALEDRRIDLAVMRVLGATRLRLFWQIVAESLILSVAGIVLGLALAHGLAWGAGRWLWTHNQILVTFGWVDGEVVLVAAVLGLGVLAALPAAVRAARIDIPRVLSGG